MPTIVDACQDLDNDGFVSGIGCEVVFLRDCDDSDPLTSPGEPEICDGLDNDCDGDVDEEAGCRDCLESCSLGEALCSGPDRVSSCGWIDGCLEFTSPTSCPSDQGCRDGGCVDICADRDGDGLAPDCGDLRDCDDTRIDVYPGNLEVCDGIDNNCDRRVDENFVCQDQCTDECTAAAQQCSGAGNAELRCEVGPNNCTGWVQITCNVGEQCVERDCEFVAVCVDVDLDGYGPNCEAGDDCLPLEPDSHPTSEDVCDGRDNDCDPSTRETCDSCLSSHQLVLSEPRYIGDCASNEVAFTASEIPGEVAFMAHGQLESVTVLGDEAPRLGETWVTVADLESVSEPITIVPSGAYRVVSGTAQVSECDMGSTEPNNAPSTATPVGSPPFITAEVLCGNDLDFYAIEVPAGGVIDAAAFVGTESVSDLALSVWRNGVEVSSSLSDLSAESDVRYGRHTFFRADLPGSYAVAVRNLSATANIPYLLSIGAQVGPCDDGRDHFDDGDLGDLDDDTFGTASVLDRGEMVSDQLCPGDLDIISLGELAAGSVIEVTVSTTDFLVARLVRGGFSGLIQESRSQGSSTQLNAVLTQGGLYYVALYGQNARQQSDYQISWNFVLD